ATAVGCDVRDGASCRRAVAAAERRLGGLDSLVYCSGIGHLGPLRDTGADVWRAIIDTNVVGASLVTAAAVDHLTPGGHAIYLSSDAVAFHPPPVGIGAYAVSKAALDQLVAAWQVEHPSVHFTRVVVGPTAGGDGLDRTELADGWDPAHLEHYLGAWASTGFMGGGLMDAADLAGSVCHLLTLSAYVPVLHLAPPPPGDASHPYPRGDP
ncbi:MAG: SDR family oxidoreductase, partial [Acidimicrobiales bacterium]